MFVKANIRFINLDLIDPSIVHQLLGFNFDYDIEFIEMIEKDHPQYDIFVNIKEMDFSTFNPILNTGGIFVFSALCDIQFMILGFIWVCFKSVYRCRRLQRERL